MSVSKILGGSLVAVLLAQPASAESIRSALASAYDSNPELNAQRAATRANDENLPQAQAGYRPTISANASAGLRQSDSNIGGVTNTTPYGYGIQISQALFSGFRTVNSVQAAKAGIRASRETLRNVEQNVLLNTAIAYANVLQSGELVSIRKQSLAFLREQVRSSQARLDVGEGTRTDLEQSRAQLSRAQAQLQAAQAQLQASRANYRQLTGREPTNLKWPSGPARLYPRSQSQGIAIAMAEHPAIRASQHLVDAQAFNVKVAEGALLPTVTLNGGANKSFNQTTQGSRNSSVEATVNVQVPIYQGGAEYSAVRQGKQTLGEQRILVDQARDQVRAQVVSAWTQLQAARANLDANRAQVRAARLALEGVVEERNVGQRTQLDVLNSQTTLLQAQELLLNARRDRVIAGYQLVAAIGRLNSRRLNLQVAHYSPKEHAKQVEDRWFGLRTPSGR
ncbi:TolC family outer membrane protein [Pseudahrensia aquimaris]|uniref:TolC family outer membrane protein n=1 Tax=Pseudahrensia aquimaris TaxID=744461 RepID=A0ABW3FKV2_9HYPH